MPKTRLFWGLTLVLVLVLVAVACGGDDDSGGEAVATEFTTSEEGKLIVGSDIPFPPFEDFTEEGEVVGFDPDLINEIASRLGLEVEWVDTDFDTIFTQLAAGQFDMVASATTITEERALVVNFSIGYYFANQTLTINAELTPEITSTADLAEGDSVAVQSGTTGEEWARTNLEPNGIEVRSFPEAPDTYIALEAGDVTGVIFDDPSASNEAANRPALEVVEILSTDETYGFPVDPENQGLLDAVNAALQGMIDDGTYQSVYDSWFPNAPGGSVAGS